MNIVSAIFRWCQAFPVPSYATRIPSLSSTARLDLGIRWPSLNKIVPRALFVLGASTAHAEVPATAFFYGSPVPVEALMHYPRVVLEAENLASVTPFIGSGTVVFAYVSVGEAEGWRTTTRDLDPKLFLGANSAWRSRIADLTQEGWTQFLIESRMAPLWQQGYRAFFLDTLDSYQMLVPDAAGRERQKRSLSNIIRAIHTRFPGVQLLLNRGFEVLPEVGNLVVGVVAESLFQGWDPTTQQYVRVRDADRAWLLEQLNIAASRYRLPVTVIDYVPTQDRALALDTSRRIRDLGFAAWVATPSLNTLSAESPK